MADNNDKALMEIGASALAPEQVKHQMDQIKELMKSVLQDGMHYGKIPGCGDKPALLQPGGQKLSLMFNLGAKYDIHRTEGEDGHRDYDVTCTLVHRTTGKTIGQGVGTCSTMESKYRYRWDDTGDDIPAEYWNKGRDPALIGGDSYTHRKAWIGSGAQRKQVWHIFRRVLHDNPADYYNTALKIGKKRAFLDAILTATAAGDIFMPDDETPPEIIGSDETGAPDAQPPIREPQSRSRNDGSTMGNVTEKQAKMLVAKLMDAGIPFLDFNREFNVGDIEELPYSRMDEALAWIKRNAAGSGG